MPKINIIQMEAEEDPMPMPGGLQPKYKIVFLGDASVGKTCIITRFMYDTFTENYDVPFLLS
jgi:GTPase SAR1 family protein